MTDEGQPLFMQRVRLALNRPDGYIPPAGVTESQLSEATLQVLETVKNRSRDQQLALLDQLIEAGKPINLNVIGLPDTEAAACAIADLAREKTPEWGTGKQVAVWHHPLIDSLNLAQALATDSVSVVTVQKAPSGEPGNTAFPVREQVANAFIGITSADFCVAESATLVLKTRPGQARSVSLLPSIHVAVITLDQVLASFTELYALLCHDSSHRAEEIPNCMTFISGPSKTADIEAVMVHGVHGPRELWLYVIINA
jgi:L-lactate dehydrogenase complex protein LldG